MVLRTHNEKVNKLYSIHHDKVKEFYHAELCIVSNQYGKKKFLTKKNAAFTNVRLY